MHTPLLESKDTNCHAAKLPLHSLPRFVCFVLALHCIVSSKGRDQHSDEQRAHRLGRTVQLNLFPRPCTRGIVFLKVHGALGTHRIASTCSRSIESMYLEALRCKGPFLFSSVFGRPWIVHQINRFYQCAKVQTVSSPKHRIPIALHAQPECSGAQGKS